MKPPTYADAPWTAVAGPGMMFTDSTWLKSTGMPSPDSPMNMRIPFMNTSADWPRMFGFAGEPKFEVVKALAVSLLNSVTSWMSMTSIWAREMIVTFLGTSRMFSSVPNTDAKGREVGRICCSIGTSLTLNFSIWTAAPVVAASVEPAVCARPTVARVARVSPASSFV